MDDRRDRQGLGHDLATMERIGNDLPSRFDRRRALQLLGGASLLSLVGCGGDASGPAAPATSATAGGSCAPIVQETVGPFPGDGSNGPNVLDDAGIVRSDITRSFGSFGSNAATGIPLTVVLAIRRASSGCAPFAGAAVHLWHCDREGRYSLYDLPKENYLRGVQEAGEDGTVTFTTIYPGAYPGRFPHLHFQVFETLAKAASATELRTSQVALPVAASAAVYETSGYTASRTTNARTTLTDDGVFRDDQARTQTPAFTGDAAGGYSIRLDVPV